MSNAPTDPESRLLGDGYSFAAASGHLFVNKIPYLSPDGPRPDGVLVLPINDIDGVLTDAQTDHTIWFVGDEPRSEQGKPLGTEFQPPRQLGNGLAARYQLSFKPDSGSYAGLYEKVRSYARILCNAAQSVDPTLTATPGAAFQSVEDKLPLVYRDTNTTRAGLSELNNRFRGHTVAIVGLGGTGSYILDQVAKTWVDRIILVDGDVMENHNAFRAPGAVPVQVLRDRLSKVEYFAGEYSRMHTGITWHSEHLSLSNIELITSATFVFLAAADADERPGIMAWLRDHGIPFVDVGMGLRQVESGLTGILKVTAYLPNDAAAVPDRPAAADADNDYATNIQVADLNALNALLAVIRWKRYLGYYATHEQTEETVFKLYLNELRNGDT